MTEPALILGQRGRFYADMDRHLAILEVETQTSQLIRIGFRLDTAQSLSGPLESTLDTLRKTDPGTRRKPRGERSP